MRFGVFFCFKQKTAYEMRISDWSSDVCSSDLCRTALHRHRAQDRGRGGEGREQGAHAGLYQCRAGRGDPAVRSEEHTSELQSLMRKSYAVFCLKKKIVNIKSFKELSMDSHTTHHITTQRNDIHMCYTDITTQH